MALLNRQAGGVGHPANLTVCEYMSNRGAMDAGNIPSDGNVSVPVTRGKPVIDDAAKSWKRSILSRVVAVIHIHEDPALRSQQPGELTQRLDSVRCGKDVSQNVPETSDHVKLASNRIQLFGPHRPALGADGPSPPHFSAGIEQPKVIQTCGAGNPARAHAIAGPDIEQRPAARWNLCDDDGVNAIQIDLMSGRQAFVYRCDVVVGCDGFQRTGGIRRLTQLADQNPIIAAGCTNLGGRRFCLRPAIITMITSVEMLARFWAVGTKAWLVQNAARISGRPGFLVVRKPPSRDPHLAVSRRSGRALIKRASLS